MLKNQKLIFGLLCVVMIVVNGFQLSFGSEGFSLSALIAGGIGGSLLSIPLWSCIGVILANIGLFFWKIAKPDGGDVLNIWQKASLGLIAGIFLKPVFGIFW